MKNSGLIKKYIGAVILPVIMLTVVISVFSSYLIKNAMYGQVRDSLIRVSSLMGGIMDRTYPGDYVLDETKDGSGNKVYSLKKGDQDITGDKCNIPAQIKEATGYEVSIIYYDTRMCSTLTESSGKSSVGTAVNSRVLNSIYEKQQPQFYENVIVNGSSYFVLYEPIKNSNGAYVCMYEFAKPTSDVKRAIRNAILPIMIVVVSAMLAVVFISVRFTGGFLSSLGKLMDFLVHVEKGNLNEQMDEKVISRKDEIGAASRAAVSMQRALARLIEYDELTEIFNRRYANRRFAKTIMAAENSGSRFAAAIGDIDFFKKVNDTYGHECGDAVLVKTADILKKNMAGHGFAARWGGEEFLLVFDREDAESAREVLERILFDIRRARVDFEGQEVKITMSFGVTEGDTDHNADQLLMRADDHLYYSKTHGRNQVSGDEVAADTHDKDKASDTDDAR